MTKLEDGEKHEFHEDDILWCPADRKHWHGATPHEGITLIALHEMVDGQNVTWLAKVTGEEYPGS